MKQRIIVKANIFKALGHPTRLWMVEQLTQGEKCVCEFVEGVDVDFPQFLSTYPFCAMLELWIWKNEVSRFFIVLPCHAY